MRKNIILVILVTSLSLGASVASAGNDAWTDEFKAFIANNICSNAGKGNGAEGEADMNGICAEVGIGVNERCDADPGKSKGKNRAAKKLEECSLPTQ
jgi:hypothetical protein